MPAMHTRQSVQFFLAMWPCLMGCQPSTHDRFNALPAHLLGQHDNELGALSVLLRNLLGLHCLGELWDRKACRNKWRGVNYMWGRVT